MSASDTIKGLLALGLPIDVAGLKIAVKDNFASSEAISNIDNTSDADKPVSTAQALAILALIDDASSHNNKTYSSAEIEAKLSALSALSGDGIAGNVDTYALLPSPVGISGKIYSVDNSSGVWGINRKSAGLYISNGTIWVVLSDFDAITSKVADNTTAISAISASISNVNNTSDINKPVSAAQLLAINTAMNSVPVPTAISLGIDKVNNTSDINKPVSSATALAISAEASRANAAEALLTPLISVSNINNTADLLKPISNAQAAVNDTFALNAALTAESSARLAADNTLATNLATETTNRSLENSVEINARNFAISAEVTRAQNAEALLSPRATTYTKTEVDGITHVVTSMASGDTLIGSPTGGPSVLPKGIDTNVLAMANGSPAWTVPIGIPMINSVSNSLDAVSIASALPITIPAMSISPVAGSYLVQFDSQYSNTVEAATAKASLDATALYNSLMALSSTATHALSLGNGETLSAGVYTIAGAATFDGTLTLNGQGNANSLFVFKISAALAPAVSSSIVLVNGATSNNVFFVCQGAFAAGASASIKGTVLVNQAAASLGANCSVEGRIITLNGASAVSTVTMTLPTGTPVLAIGSLAMFSIFCGVGAPSNAGASIIPLSIGTNSGAATGWETASISGKIYTGAALSASASYGLYLDGILVAGSIRNMVNSIPMTGQNVSLRSVVSITAGQALDVRILVGLGVFTTGGKVLTLTRSDVQVVGVAGSVNTDLLAVEVARAKNAEAAAITTASADATAKVLAETNARITATSSLAPQLTTYTIAQTDARIASVVGVAPSALDTLGEIAVQLLSDETAAGALTTAVSLKAPSANPVFTGTVSGISASMVGLGNANNTSDLAKPISTAQALVNSTFALGTALTAETATRASADTTNTAAISTETTRATAAEALLATNIALAAETTSRTTSYAANATAISSEVTRSTSAETTLTTNLASEVSSRSLAITAEVTARNAAILVETTRATSAEVLLAPLSAISNINNTSDASKPVSSAQALLNATFLTSVNPVITGLLEKLNVVTIANTGVINIDAITSSVWFYTTAATANFTINMRGSPTTTLNSLLAVGQIASIGVINTSGATAYYPLAFQIDGVAVTPKWQGGTAPTAGNVSSLDIYTLEILKTAVSTYTVLASQTKFA